MTSLLDPVARRIGHARTFWVCIAIATLLGAGLRFYKLEVPGVWIDELWTVYTAGDLTNTHRSKVFGYLPTWLGLQAMGVDTGQLRGAENDASHWQSLGVTHLSARLGSVVTGILCIPLLAGPSRRLLGWGPAIILAFLLAISPWHIYWSQAARFYTLQFLFYSLALILYFTATEERSRSRYILAMVCLVLSFLSQPTGMVILGIFALDWAIGIARRRPVRLHLFGWVTGGLAVGLCAGILAMDYVDAPREWAPFLSFGGAHAQPSAVALAMGTTYMTGPTIALVAIATAWWIRASHPRLAIYLLLAAALPVALFSIWSIWNNVGLRYLMVCLYGWLALAAIGIDRVSTLLARRDWLLGWVPLLVVISSWSVLLLAYYTNAYGFHPRWPDAYRYVQMHARDGDVVACRHPLIGRYYLQDPAVAHMPLTYEDLAALGDRVWLIVERQSTSDRDIGDWALEVCELKDQFSIAVPRPVSQVSVLLYERGRTDTPPPN